MFCLHYDVLSPNLVYDTAKEKFVFGRFLFKVTCAYTIHEVNFIWNNINFKSNLGERDCWQRVFGKDKRTEAQQFRVG